MVLKYFKDLDSAVEAFLKGEIGVFPTDTVWGVGCILNSEKAIKRLYKIKKRDFKKPTAVLVASLEQAKELGKFDEKAERLARKYWPGGLTLVLPISPPRCFYSKIGLRVPDHDLLLKILQKTGPIAATSANFTGETAPIKRKEIREKFLKEVDFLIESKEPKEGQASTVVDITVRPFKVLREGVINLSPLFYPLTSLLAFL